MTEIPDGAQEISDQIFGLLPVETNTLDQLLRFLELLPCGHAEKKYVLILWLARAGIDLESWMVGRLGGS